MSLFSKGLGHRVSIHANSPRPISSPIRPLRRVRQSRRHNSSQHSKSEIPAEGKANSTSVEDASSVNANNPAKPCESHTRPTPSQSSSATPCPSPQAAGPAGSAAGAASTPSVGNIAVRSRGFREIIKAGRVGQLGRWYTRVQERKPYATQLYSSIIVYLCGDLSAQLLFPSEAASPSKTEQEDGKTTAQSKGEDEKERRGGYDPWRTVRHLIVGAGSSIPSYNWFMFLHNNFNYSSKFLSILTKVVVQQMCFTPVFNTYFFSLHSLLAGATLEETWERLKKALPVSVTNSVKLWPAVTAFSFMYVPPQFRNVFQGGIAVCWQTYLSWLNQNAAREVLAAELAAEKPLSQNSTVAPMTGSLITAAGTA